MPVMDDRLAILVPVTSRGAAAAVDSVLNGLSQLAGSMAENITSKGSEIGALTTETQHAADCSRTAPCILENGPAVNKPFIVLLGIDADDAALLQHQQECIRQFSAVGVHAVMLVLDDHAPGAVCQIWSKMAKVAVNNYGCNLAVLLGDDIEVSPSGWPDKVLTAFQKQPDLMLLLLNDISDPGFPSFPVLRADAHLEVFGELLPPCFINQGGDPYLAAMYRRWQRCIKMLPDVQVHNKIGGVQRSEQAYAEPRYARQHIAKDIMLHELLQATKTLSAWSSAADEPGLAMNSRRTLSTNRDKQAEHPMLDTTMTGSQDVDACVKDSLDANVNNTSSSIVSAAADTAIASPAAAVSEVQDRPQLLASDQRQLTLDVLVPTYRVDLKFLKAIASAVLDSPGDPGCDIQLIIVVDQPASSITAEARAWLQQLQDLHLNKVRVRIHERNLGASASRNTALQESFAEYVLFWDDDITPSPGCIPAYVQAIRQHPQALGFVGPSYVAREPGSVWACAVHQADVLFFWDAAADWRVAEVVPWAVTANVTMVNTAQQFDLRFPKTGGGEDIHYCLEVTGGRLIPVPQAIVHHPLWGSGKRCYNRFFGWAYGDGALMAMYPQLCYLNWPNSAEALCMLLLLASAAAITAVGFAVDAAVSANTALQYCCVAAFWCLMHLAAAAIGYKAVDLLLDVIRSCHPVRLAKHPCATSLIRLAAAAEASLIKTWSEVGRLWGLADRRELFPTTTDNWQLPFTRTPVTVPALAWPRVCQRFDWFCGLSQGIVHTEKHRGFWRFTACCAGAWAAAAVAGGAQALLEHHAVSSTSLAITGGSGTNGKLHIVHLLTAGAAVVAGCGFMLWRLEG